jgi:hypothetical protein
MLSRSGVIGKACVSGAGSRSNHQIRSPLTLREMLVHACVKIENELRGLLRTF